MEQNKECSAMSQKCVALKKIAVVIYCERLAAGGQSRGIDKSYELQSNPSMTLLSNQMCT